MLVDLFPRAHARFLSLSRLGAENQGFALWLGTHGSTRDSHVMWNATPHADAAQGPMSSSLGSLGERRFAARIEWHHGTVG